MSGYRTHMAATEPNLLERFDALKKKINATQAAFWFALALLVWKAKR